MNIEFSPQLVVRPRLPTVLAIVLAIWLFAVAATGAAAMRALDRYEIDIQTEALRRELKPAALVNSVSSINDKVLAIHRLSWSLDKVNRRLLFFRINARVIGWVPLVGSNFRATVDSFDQARAIAKSSEEILLAVESVVELGSGDVSFSTFRNVADFERFLLTVRSAKEHVGNSVKAIDAAPNYSVADLPLIVGSLRSRARTVGDDYTQSRELTIWLSTVMTGVDLIVTNSRGMIEAVESLSPGDRSSVSGPDIVALEYERFLTGLEQADEHFQAASDLMPSLIEETELSVDILAATRIFHALRPSLENSTELVVAAFYIVNLYNSPDVGGLTDGTLLRTLSTELSGVERSLDRVLDQMSDFRSTFAEDARDISSSRQSLIRVIDQKLAETLSVMTTARVFAGEIEHLIGSGNRARYLLLGVNSDEIRASGGFVSNVWVLELVDGAIMKPEAFDVTSLDNRAVLDQYPKADSELQLHMNAPMILMRDVTWDPHYPTVASEAIEIFELSGAESDFSGVFLLNQNVFASLVEALGGIKSDGNHITGDAVVELLKTGTDEFGRNFVDQVLTDLFNELDSVSEVGTAFDLAKSVSNSLRSRNLQLYFVNEKLQQRLESHQIAGAMLVTKSDRFYVVDSNVGWSKSNQFVTRTTDYSIDLASPEPKAEILLKYHHSGSKALASKLVENSEIAANDIGKNADEQNVDAAAADGSECGDQFQVDVLSYEQLGDRCYWNLVRIYVPEGSVIRDLPHLPLPLVSVAVQTGRAREGDESSAVSLGREGLYISGLVQVAAKDTVEFRYEYSPPASIVQNLEGVFTYSLLLSPQPGIINEEIVIRILLPDTAEITYSSHPLESVGTDTVMTTIFLNETSELIVKYVVQE